MIVFLFLCQPCNKMATCPVDPASCPKSALLGSSNGWTDNVSCFSKTTDLNCSFIFLEIKSELDKTDSYLQQWSRSWTTGRGCRSSPRCTDPDPPQRGRWRWGLTWRMKNRQMHLYLCVYPTCSKGCGGCCFVPPAVTSHRASCPNSFDLTPHSRLNIKWN